MTESNPRVDAYIARSAPFAQPILTWLREVIHKACPEVEETIKWGMPYFTYHGMLAGMAAFKAHCAFGFWRWQELGESGSSDDAMGQFGKITAIRDLPSKSELTKLIKRAMVLNESGRKKAVKKSSTPKPAPQCPPDLDAALRKSPAARSTYQRLPPSHQREYVEWLEEAKREETRKRRLATTIEWLSEGKSRNWKYER